MSTPAAEIDLAVVPERSPSRWALSGAFAVIYLVWGSTFLGIRVAVETLPPLSMAAIRFLVSGGILLLASSRVRPRPTLLQWRNAAVVGALFFLCLEGALQLVGPILTQRVIDVALPRHDYSVVWKAAVVFLAALAAVVAGWLAQYQHSQQSGVEHRGDAGGYRQPDPAQTQVLPPRSTFGAR